MADSRLSESQELDRLRLEQVTSAIEAWVESEEHDTPILLTPEALGAEGRSEWLAEEIPSLIEILKRWFILPDKENWPKPDDDGVGALVSQYQNIGLFCQLNRTQHIDFYLAGLDYVY